MVLRWTLSEDQWKNSDWKLFCIEWLILWFNFTIYKILQWNLLGHMDTLCIRWCIQWIKDLELLVKNGMVCSERKSPSERRSLFSAEEQPVVMNVLLIQLSNKCTKSWRELKKFSRMVLMVLLHEFLVKTSIVLCWMINNFRIAFYRNKV